LAAGEGSRSPVSDDEKNIGRNQDRRSRSIDILKPLPSSTEVIRDSGDSAKEAQVDEGLGEIREWTGGRCEKRGSGG